LVLLNIGRNEMEGTTSKKIMGKNVDKKKFNIFNSQWLSIFSKLKRKILEN